MKIKQIEDLLDSMSGIERESGDIDSYWRGTTDDDRYEVVFMLTHTKWCRGETNDDHDLLIFIEDPQNDNEPICEPIILTSFHETLRTTGGQK